MFVVLENRETIAAAIVDCFEREGVAAIAVGFGEFEAWFEGLNDVEASAIEAVMLGGVDDRQAVPAFVNCRSKIPVVAMLDGRGLRETLDLFSSGVSDVVTKPFHVREILARVGAIRRRGSSVDESLDVDGIRIFFDGQDPEINGVPLPLPRRERRILEYLMLSRNLRVTKMQIFNRVYGVFNERIHENVIESHISRLRKRLKGRLGFDPIDSQRYLGYRFVSQNFRKDSAGGESWMPSLAQGPDGSLGCISISDQENFDGSLRSHDGQRVRDVCAG